MKLTKKDYLFYIAISLLITLFIVYVFRYSCKCSYRRNEGFQNNVNNDNSFIKKTTTYKKIFSESNGAYSIWEPETMSSYYPMAHVYQKGTKPPRFPSYLLKANSDDEESKPEGFLPICKINDSMAVWVPHCREGYSPIGMIFSKDAPSIHKFRCVRKEHTDDIVLENAFFNSSDIQLWKIKDNQFFIGLNLMNLGEDKTPRGDVRRLLPQKLKTECNFEIEMTKDYKEIGTMKNEMTKKIVSLWRPIAHSGYVSLGDIALEGYQNPNGVVETPVVKYSQSSPPLHFGKKIATIEVEQDIISVEKKDDDKPYITPTKTMSIWKPVANKGYGSVGCIITEGEEEPATTSIIGCIPLDMVKTIDKNCQKVLKLLWNNEPNESSTPLSLWIDSTNRLHVNKQATLQCVEMEPLSILDPDSLLKKLEKPQAVILMTYERLDTNTSNYTFSEKINAIQTTLSKLGNASLGTFHFLGKSEKQKTNSLFRFGIVGNSAKATVKNIVLNAQTREMENKLIYVSHTKSKRPIGLLKELHLE
jgi:hypothetical protein